MTINNNIEHDSAPTIPTPAEVSPPESSPAEAAPVKASPVEAASALARRVVAMLEVAKRTVAKRMKAAAVEPRPVEAKPTDADSVESSPAAANQVETSPVESVSAESVSVEPVPVEADSMEASPPEADQAETGPAEAVVVEAPDAAPAVAAVEAAPVSEAPEPVEPKLAPATAAAAEPAAVEAKSVETAALGSLKQPPKRRFWVLTVLALGMLLVGHVLGSYLSVVWAQNYPSTRTTFLTWLAQAPLPEGVKTTLADALPGAKVSRILGPTPGLTPTPAPPNTSPTSMAGIVTVYTLTPTEVGSSTDLVHTPTGQVPPNQGPAATQSPVTATPPASPGDPAAQLPPAILLPTATWTPAASVPPAAPGQGPSLSQLEADLQTLQWVMQDALVAMLALGQGQPADEDLAAMSDLVNGMVGQMAVLSAQLQAAQAAAETATPAATETPGTDAPVLPGEVLTLLDVMQQELGILQTVLADPATDSAARTQGQTLLGQLRGMMGQAQILMAQMLAARPPDSASTVPTPANTPDPTATPTPTITPAPTATPAPTVVSGPSETPGITPTPESGVDSPGVDSPGVDSPGVDSHLSQLQAMMGRMEQMLGQMQSMLLQMKNFSHPKSIPSVTPAPGNPSRKNRSTPAMGTPGAAAPDARTPQPNPTESAPVSMGNMARQVQGAMGSMQGMADMMACMEDTGGNAADAVPIIPDSPLTRTSQVGSVTMAVTPANLRKPGMATFDFYIVLDTHSVDLSQDLTGLAVLRMPSGVELAAMRWTGPRGGHHVEGTLSFPRTDAAGSPVVVPSTGALTLAVRNLAGVGERSFPWDLARVH